MLDGDAVDFVDFPSDGKLCPRTILMDGGKK
jgi:hypothetical protein